MEPGYSRTLPYFFPLHSVMSQQVLSILVIWSQDGTCGSTNRKLDTVELHDPVQLLFRSKAIVVKR